MQSTSHSVEDWSRVGSAKGRAQRGLTRADAANLTMVSIFERHTTPPSPRAVSRQRGSTPRGDHLSDLLSSSLHLGLRDPEHGTREATCARASLLVLVLSSSLDLGLRGYLGSGPDTGVHLRKDHHSCRCFALAQTPTVNLRKDPSPWVRCRARVTAWKTGVGLEAPRERSAASRAPTPRNP